MSKTYKILAVNPGSTSTKTAVYENEDLVHEFTLRHSAEELAEFETVADQFGFRKDLIIKNLEEAGVDTKHFDAVIGRGGLVKPVESGVYDVNEALRSDLSQGLYGQHASNLGALIAYDIAAETGAAAYIADPVVVDELEDVARITGMPGIEHVSIFHALNQKAVAREFARGSWKKYEEMNLVIAHLGGGISVGAHQKGRVVDVNNALDGDGPFSPERAGTIPAGQLVKECFHGGKSEADIKRKLTGAGGVVAHLGTNNILEVTERIEKGDEQAKNVLDAMCYNIGKAIGAMAAVLRGGIDAIILTGGIAYSDYVCGYIKDMVGFISDVTVVPGENELEALAMNALRVLRGEEKTKTYYK